VNNWAAAGVGVAVLGIAVGSAPIVFIGAAIILIRIVADRWPRRVLDSLAYEREVSPRKTVVGDEVELKLSLWNRSRLPIAWAVAQDTLAERLTLNPPTAVPSIAGPMRPFERVTRRLRVTPTRRGVHEVGPVRLGVAEHFGTHMPKLDKPTEHATVIARPLMAPVVGTSPQSAPLAQIRAKRSLYTDPTLFAGVRPFQTGDPLRSVHWRASARAASLQTKRYEPALSRQQVIILDVQTIEGPYWMLDYDEDLFEELCVAALSLARLLVSQDASCGFAAAGFQHTTQRYVYLPPRADRAQIERIGDVLARMTPESSAPLVNLLAWLPHRVAKGTMLTILTGRGTHTSAAVVKRLEQSGFPVHFLLFRDGADGRYEARQLGLSAMPAAVEMDGNVPTAVVINA
jgi:uncharacterized protein (DUF58 family)